jgi:phospholipase/lecithinase/hemolysin
LIATYNKTLVLSYNFAYGGATTDASLVTPYESTVLSFVDQTTEFSNNLVPAPSYAPWTSSNALFAVWMGVNDVGNAWYASNWTTIASAVVTRYFQESTIMYNAGARNFLFLTVPPIQYTPLVVAEGTTTQGEVATAITYFNGLLNAAAASFKSAHSGSTVYVYVTTTPFMTAINNPTAYGSPDATCYNANGVSCLWYNNYHPGQAIHKLVAQGISSLTGI